MWLLIESIWWLIWWEIFRWKAPSLEPRCAPLSRSRCWSCCSAARDECRSGKVWRLKEKPKSYRKLKWHIEDSNDILIIEMTYWELKWHIAIEHWNDISKIEMISMNHNERHHSWKQKHIKDWNNFNLTKVDERQSWKHKNVLKIKLISTEWKFISVTPKMKNILKTGQVLVINFGFDLSQEFRRLCLVFQQMLVLQYGFFQVWCSLTSKISLFNVFLLYLREG